MDYRLWSMDFFTNLKANCKIYLSSEVKRENEKI